MNIKYPVTVKYSFVIDADGKTLCQSSNYAEFIAKSLNDSKPNWIRKLLNLIKRVRK